MSETAAVPRKSRRNLLRVRNVLRPRLRTCGRSCPLLATFVVAGNLELAQGLLDRADDELQFPELSVQRLQLPFLLADGLLPIQITGGILGLGHSVLLLGRAAQPILWTMRIPHD